MIVIYKLNELYEYIDLLHNRWVDNGCGEYEFTLLIAFNNEYNIQHDICDSDPDTSYTSTKETIMNIPNKEIEQILEFFNMEYDAELDVGEYAKLEKAIDSGFAFAVIYTTVI